jgi:hypothetical protein
MIALRNLKVPAVPFWETGTLPTDNTNTFLNDILLTVLHPRKIGRKYYTCGIFILKKYPLSIFDFFQIFRKYIVPTCSRVRVSGFSNLPIFEFFQIFRKYIVTTCSRVRRSGFSNLPIFEFFQIFRKYIVPTCLRVRGSGFQICQLPRLLRDDVKDWNMTTDIGGIVLMLENWISQRNLLQCYFVYPRSQPRSKPGLFCYLHR